MSRYIDYDNDEFDDMENDGLDPADDGFDPSSLSNNALAFIALANEYCAACENAATADPADFVASMLRLLPRLYIAAGDIRTGLLDDGSAYIAPALDEDGYEQVRASIAAVMGENDTFLEVFEQDMKYSDTPIAATVSESLADLFQVFYDLLETARNAPNEIINEALGAVRASFAEYWSQTLVNVLRPLNAVRYQA